jgi:hypothetical protein
MAARPSANPLSEVVKRIDDAAEAALEIKLPEGGEHYVSNAGGRRRQGFS